MIEDRTRAGARCWIEINDVVEFGCLPRQAEALATKLRLDIPTGRTATNLNPPLDGNRGENCEDAADDTAFAFQHPSKSWKAAGPGPIGQTPTETFPNCTIVTWETSRKKICNPVEICFFDFPANGSGQWRIAVHGRSPVSN
ncbi:hypothetical protein [Hyphomicrobium sp.]|uniref:hypothetical protein n=1 Tax=Hyphomicrobium sp. TaxID=82 RepID=UPI001E044C68|nr:hypothetical protein [Hyphomicrobium sp.]MBY0561643.1 hypothetical protein [Hyphomicrobium sp.]